MRHLIGPLALILLWIAAPVAADAQRRTAAADVTEAAVAEGLVRKGDMGVGSLLLESIQPGLYVEAPRIATDVKFDITGPIVRARVTQRFENPTDQWVEGVYVFPLPEDAGVDTLKMMIGDRLIEGVIKEREEARQIYEEARAAGQRASLVEQERANIFTNSVANIGPGETIIVQIEYQDTAHLENGVFSMRFPMVVAPRYSPDPDVVMVADVDGATGFAISDPVPDADRISPPVVRPEFEPEEPRLPVTIEADLRAGFPLGDVESLYHEIAVAPEGDARAQITLAASEVPANRDFVLEWRAADGAQPHAALFKEVRDGMTYVLAMVTPPAELGANAPRRPREAIFVIDNSGSMAGPSMAEAKAALLLALDRLEPSDTFNVIRFDDTMDVVFADGAVPATTENVSFAKGFVAGLEATGGTEMLPALKAALVDHTPGDDRVRQVVFLTDGAIGNEAQLFQAIDDALGRSRLFTVGIGSAPNSFFMTRAARIGRGTFTYIGDVDEVEERAAELFEALERPVMTDLLAEFPPGMSFETWPNPLPDLYAGEPVALTARVPDAFGEMTVSGSLHDTRWAARLALANAAEGAGVSTLWARSKIADIEESRFEGASYEEVDRQVLATALEYSLVSRLTSLVAVDVEVARPANVPARQVDVPTMLPEGWEFDKVFGPDIQPLGQEAMLDHPQFAQLATRATVDGPQTDAAGLPLPRGSTPAQLWMLAGLALMLAALVFALREARAPARVRARANRR